METDLRAFRIEAEREVDERLDLVSRRWQVTGLALGTFAMGLVLHPELGVEPCRELLEEMRIYRHEKGLVKPNQDDHLIDALHKAMMMLRYAKAPAHGAQKGFEVYTTPQARGDYEFF